MKKLSLLLFFTLVLLFQGSAQDKYEVTDADYSNQTVEMADAFREDGKIYVVLAVILVLLAGLFTYLFIIDRKLTKLEKQSDKSLD